ncbi:hypothetical protein CWB59_12485 [Pseudoalteromonas sp. S326]|uniref:hypothetical protein n=1 Tax=Pseudoalteromonas sp. S326 TaxID=579533 RepID=UPI00110C1947|nr:hypothetical protein [Pseudoalteromonas sp. S326]TMO16731.1 hypothetical protein CWB59_12485 [Pseudoalteromonas sp. S326]
MAQLRELIPLVRERSGGVIDKFALEHLKRAYQKFCTESRFLARQIMLESGSAKQLPVDDLHVFGDVAFVLDDNGRELLRGNDYTVSTSGELTLHKSTPYYNVFYHINPQRILPDDFDANDEVVNRWAEYLADGAASTLMKMPNTAWTELNVASYYSRVFTEGYREAYRVAVNALDEQRPKQTRVFY